MTLLTVRDAAKYLKIHPETVRTKLREGTLKGVKVGTVWRIKREDLDRFLE